MQMTYTALLLMDCNVTDVRRAMTVWFVVAGVVATLFVVRGAMWIVRARILSRHHSIVESGDERDIIYVPGDPKCGDADFYDDEA